VTAAFLVDVSGSKQIYPMQELLSSSRGVGVKRTRYCVFGPTVLFFLVDGERSAVNASKSVRDTSCVMMYPSRYQVLGLDWSGRVLVWVISGISGVLSRGSVPDAVVRVDFAGTVCGLGLVLWAQAAATSILIAVELPLWDLYTLE